MGTRGTHSHVRDCKCHDFLNFHIHFVNFRFQKQQVDLDTLMLLTESDLKSLQLPLGPFRKLATAIQERKNALLNPGTIQDSRL